MAMEYRSFLSDVADDSDFATLDLDGDGREDKSVDSRLLGRVDVSCQHREIGPLDERYQAIDSVVKFVIA